MRPSEKEQFAAMEKAVGPWPWRVEQIAATSGKPISKKMTLLLALVVFEGYELFPGRKKERGPDAKRV